MQGDGKQALVSAEEDISYEVSEQVKYVERYSLLKM